MDSSDTSGIFRNKPFMVSPWYGMDIKWFVGRNFTYLHLDKAMPMVGRAKRGEMADEER